MVPPVLSPSGPRAGVKPAPTLVFVLGLPLLAGCNTCLHQAEAPCLEPTQVTVTQVIDGDTFDFEPALELPDGSTVDRGRLLCVDTPELTGGECYGDEAKQWLTDRLDGEEVTLHFADECTGTYDRALVYVVKGTELVNVEVAREGFALPMDEWFSDYPCCDDVGEAVSQAQDAGVGGWGYCGGYPWVE